LRHNFTYPPNDRGGPDRLFWRVLQVLMAEDFDAKTREWISQLTTRRGNLLRDYADENFCLIFRPDTLTTNNYNTFATPDVL
jgi:hypothetical protein